MTIQMFRENNIKIPEKYKKYRGGHLKLNFINAVYHIF